MDKFLKNNTNLFFITLSIAMLLLIIAVTILFTSQKKTAFIDNSIVIDNYKGITAMRDKLRKNMSGAEEKAGNMQKEIDELKTKLIDQSDKINAQEISKLKKNINKKEMEYNNFISGINKQLSELEKEATAPIIKEINEKINTFGQKHNYDIIFGAASYGNIVYSKKNLNITSQVIKYLNDEYDKKNQLD